jgi:hypothetical protein
LHLANRAITRAIVATISADALLMAGPNWRTSAVEVRTVQSGFVTSVVAVGSASPASEQERAVAPAAVLAAPES